MKKRIICCLLILFSLFSMAQETEVKEESKPHKIALTFGLTHILGTYDFNIINDGCLFETNPKIFVKFFE